METPSKSDVESSEDEIENKNNQKSQLKFPWHNQTEWDSLIEYLVEWRVRFSDVSKVSDRRIGLKEMITSKRSVGVDLAGLKALPDVFFQETLNLMLQKIEEGPKIFAAGLAITSTNQPSTIELTKEKTFVLMSLSFFGLFSYGFPDLLRNPEYAQCMGNYYVRMYKESVKDSNWMQKPMKIERRVLTQRPPYETSTKKLRGLKIFEGKIGIEDLRDACQINFADPYPGGTLPSSHGDIVQEEILFLVYPELFITCLLVPRIDSREAIVVSGLTRTNKYKGYQWSFSYAGDFDTDTNDITIIHMDALPGGERDKSSLDRELNKAYISFINLGDKPVGTGHWGCGAFGGNHQRKAIIQLIAAAEACVDLQYTTYGTKHINGFQQFYDEMVKHNITVSDLYAALLKRLGWGRGPIFQEVAKEIMSEKGLL